MDLTQRLDFLRSLAPDRSLADLETVARLRAGEGGAGLESVGGDPSPLVGLAETLVERPETLSDVDLSQLEAIIIPDRRPVFLVRDGDIPPTGWEGGVLDTVAARAVLKTALPAVGRVELDASFGLPFAGTAFFVGEGLMMTNRHVASLFTQGLGRSLTYTAGAAGVDLAREHQREAVKRLTVDDVVLIHPWFDMALLRVSGDLRAISPLVLSATPAADAVGRTVAVIGYPAYDTRNPGAVQDALFGGVYEVKRVMPGLAQAARRVRSFDHMVNAMTHDASTLGGASGSCLVDVATGHVLGLHFGGAFRVANFAVAAHDLAGDARVVDAGVQVAESVARTGPWTTSWAALEGTEARARSSAPVVSASAGDAGVVVTGGAGASAPATSSSGDSIEVEIPIRVRIDIGGLRTTVAAPASPPAPIREALDPEAEEFSIRAQYAESAGALEGLESVVALEAPGAAFPRTAVRLIADSESPCLRHLATPASQTAFRFDTAALQRLVTANGFDAGIDAWGGNLVLFALRGCRLADDADYIAPERDFLPKLGFSTNSERGTSAFPLWAATPGFVTSAMLVEDTITHVLPRCLVGVWNRDAGTFALVRGTTTPNWDYSGLAVAARRNSDSVQGDANMMLTGLYKHAVGSHKKIPDAFRLQETGLGVVRPRSTNKTEICYTVTDRYWYDTVSQDNMHPSMARDGSAVDYIFHYSAGCTTIQGWFESNTQLHKGAWSVLRSWAGLRRSEVDRAAIGRRFSYVLLTGREARLAASGAADAAIRRLRFGSKGAAVAQLQRGLNKALGTSIGADGDFGLGTQKALVRYQWSLGANRNSFDGVLAPAEAAALGVTL